MRTLIRTAIVITATVLVGTAVPARGADPFGTTPCSSGVRPGALIQSPAQDFYTMGFMFKDQYGARYVSTVGDHVLTSVGKKAWKVGTGPRAKSANGKIFGRFVYAAYQDTAPDGTPQYDTFGLVRLTTGFKYSPQVCYFGGPTAIYTGRGTSVVQLNYYGQGTPFDGSLPARTALAFGTGDKDGVIGVGAPAFGDSGAPVLIGGKALGILTDYGVGLSTTAPNAGDVLVTRLPKWIAAVQKALKVKLYLLTAKSR
jgi:hypothetical protein